MWDLQSELSWAQTELSERGHRLSLFEPSDDVFEDVWTARCERCGGRFTVERTAKDSTLLGGDTAWDELCRPSPRGPGPHDGIRRPVGRQPLDDVVLKKAA